MKKIGIITFHKAYNYGALLQAFALKKKLILMDNHVHIIDYNNKFLYKNYRLIHPFRKNIFKYLKILYLDIKNYKINKKRKEMFDSFIDKNFDLINVKVENELDCIITGSDQVWNIDITGKLDDFYTLNNKECENVKNKISYAASVGDSNLIIQNQHLYKQKISKLNHISVREENAKKELLKIINKDINVVLDPTLLLTNNDWNREIYNKKMVDEDYILAYVVEPDKDYIKIVNKLSEDTGLKVIHFGLENPGYKNVLKSAYTEGPFEFINYIKNAKYVVATSFHATVFSIIFNRKFFIIPHKKTGARVTNLLDKLSIKGRTFNSYDEFKNIDYDFDTNWEEVNKKLDIEREKSINWLLNAINNEKE